MSTVLIRFEPLNGSILYGQEHTAILSEGVQIVRVPRGMTSGKSSVAILASNEEGAGKPQVMIEISMAHFLEAARAFKSCERSVSLKERALDGVTRLVDWLHEKLRPKK